MLAPSPAEVEPLLRTALEIEAASWKGEAGTALLHDAPRLSFFREWTRLAAARGELRLAFLRIGGEPAAMQVAAAPGGCYRLLKIGYDNRFARASPGVLLLVETLRWAAGAGLERFELLGMPAEWTRVWAPEERPSLRVLALPATARAVPGAAALASRLAGTRVRRLSLR